MDRSSSLDDDFTESRAAGDGGLRERAFHENGRLRLPPSDRRLVGLFVLFVLVAAGTGVGTLAFLDDDSGEDTPGPVIRATPQDPDGTPTPVPPGSGTPSAATVPTPTERESVPATPPPASPTDGGSRSTSTEPDDHVNGPSTASARRDGASASSGGSGGDDSGSVSLDAHGTAALLAFTDLAPDRGGRETVTFENVGERPGRLSISTVSVLDRENGLRDPERGVDASPHAGELSETLLVTLSIRYPDGDRVYFFGTDAGYVPLSTVSDRQSEATGDVLGPGDSATVVLEWKLPADVGNRVQSDVVEFDVGFRLTAAT